MPFANPHLEFVFAKVGNKRQKLARAIVHGLARHDPTHMGPQAAISRRVRITLLVGVLMVNAVRRYPSDGSTFESKCAAHGQEILEPFRSLIAAVRQKPVVTDPDTETTGDPPQHNCQCQSFPCKEEQRCYSADMKSNHERSRNPVNRL